MEQVLKTSLTDVHANIMFYNSTLHLYKIHYTRLIVFAYIKRNNAFRYFYDLIVQYAHTWKKNTNFLSNIVVIQNKNDSHHNAPFK